MPVAELPRLATPTILRTYVLHRREWLCVTRCTEVYDAGGYEFSVSAVDEDERILVARTGWPDAQFILPPRFRLMRKIDLSVRALAQRPDAQFSWTPWSPVPKEEQ